MFRATTPVHEFIFYDDPTNYVKILITYTQKNRIILEKTKDDLSFETIASSDGTSTQYVASLQLSQDETKMFHTYDGSTIEVQIRVLDNEGNAFASEKQPVQLKDVFNDSTLSLTNGELLNIRLQIVDDDSTVYASEVRTMTLRNVISDVIWSNVPDEKKSEAKLEIQLQVLGDNEIVYASDVHLIPLNGVLINE